MPQHFLVVDAAEAREAVVAAEFLVQRLRKAVPQLQTRLQQVQLHERYSRWLDESERVKPRHDAAVERLKAVYLEVESKLVDALSEAQVVDDEVKRLSNTKPYDAPEAHGDGCNCKSASKRDPAGNERISLIVRMNPLPG